VDVAQLDHAVIVQFSSSVASRVYGGDRGVTHRKR